ncbi:UNVERIFIED_CONTAM: hypothetical protein NCL1_37432 [Trichonephila clavipes]
MHVTNLYGTFPLLLLGVFGDCKFAYIFNKLWKKKIGYSNKLRYLRRAFEVTLGRLIYLERTTLQPGDIL